MKSVVRKFRSIVITSGTLSPPEMLPKLLQLSPIVNARLSISLARPCLCPLIVSKGDDQTTLNTKHKMRDDADIVRNYGLLLLRFSSIIPDGIVCFFTSYGHMEMVFSMWFEMGIVQRISENKLVFVESSNLEETTLALSYYRKACDDGRGAVLLSVARGKVSEGIDFDHHYGRCVILFGIPYVYTESTILKARLKYLQREHGIREGDFLTFDAMRQAAQCVGRVLRGKSDYGVMVFADQRYTRADKRSKLPQWLDQYLVPGQVDLDTDCAASISKTFLKEMAQPLDRVRDIVVEFGGLIECF